MINFRITDTLRGTIAMTFSVLALDRATGAVGGAAATGNLAVGAWVLRAAARAGAVATQGFSVSSLWGDEGLASLARGESPGDVVSRLTHPDPGREYRQLAVMDAEGRSAAWTGSHNRDRKGHVAATGCVFAGNWLSNDTVLPEMERAYRDATAANGELGRRLLAALDAAVEAGGDARGTFSAAIRIVHPGRSPLDLRVDHDADPLARLHALYDMATRPPYSEWARRVPTLDDPYRC